MPAATPTARDILIDARALIASPQAWTQGTGARCCIADYLTMDFPDYFVRRRRGFLTLFGLCRIDDEPVPTHFCLPREGERIVSSCLLGRGLRVSGSDSRSGSRGAQAFQGAGRGRAVVPP